MITSMYLSNFISMATGGRLLTGGDPVTDQLLSHVSHHVFPVTRKQFAIEHLKLRDSQYENIVWDERSSGNISYEVSWKALIFYFISLIYRIRWTVSGLVYPLSLIILRKKVWMDQLHYPSGLSVKERLKIARLFEIMIFCCKVRLYQGK